MSLVPRVVSAHLRGSLVTAKVTERKPAKRRWLAYDALAQSFLRRLYGKHWMLGAWIPAPYWGRVTRISQALRGITVRVYRGQRWRRLLVQRWHLGYQVGEFARTRKLASYRAKVRTKKKKKFGLKQKRSAFLETRRIESIRQVKVGKQRHTTDYDAGLETQLRTVSWEVTPQDV